MRKHLWRRRLHLFVLSGSVGSIVCFIWIRLFVCFIWISRFDHDSLSGEQMRKCWKQCWKAAMSRSCKFVLSLRALQSMYVCMYVCMYYLQILLGCKNMGAFRISLLGWVDSNTHIGCPPVWAPLKEEPCSMSKVWHKKLKPQEWKLTQEKTDVNRGGLSLLRNLSIYLQFLVLLVLTQSNLCFSGTIWNHKSSIRHISKPSRIASSS